jgi:PhnB protein
MVKPIPDGFTAITPYLIISDVSKEIAFLKQAVSATERVAMPGPGGTVMHAEMEIAGARIMMGCSITHPPKPAMVYVYVPDVDAAFARAAAFEGAAVEMPVANQFYGDRSGTVRTANGISWCFATHVEDVTPEQMRERMKGR